MKKQVLVSVDRGETRVAMLEAAGEPAPPKSRRGRRRKKGGVPTGYRVAEVYIERRGGRSIVGNIYKGKVDNVLPGLEAAFVDIGLEKNGFLHVDELVFPGLDTGRRGRGKSGPRIADLLKPGDEIVVQVVKDPLKTKGARLSMDLTIAGRYMVYAPTGEGVGVSRRLGDRERDRLRREAHQLNLSGGGAIIRTAAHGASRADFERELEYLYRLNSILQSRVESSTAPALVFQEADLAIRVVRDIFSAQFERAIVDDRTQHERLVGFFERTAPELVDRVELWDSKEAGLFEAYGVTPVLEALLRRRIDLPSGGYLIIDYAEALTVIDVNTGSFTGQGKQAQLEDTITKINLEAAQEVVRQLRLRDIGGIIVIDFIDMARGRNRDAVLKTLREALEEDRTKTFVVEISPLGLVEMTRQNVTDGVREILTKRCPMCGGEGVVKSEETVAIEVQRKLREVVEEAGPDGPEAYLVRINPRVSAQFTAHNARGLTQFETETGHYFHFEGTEGLPLDYFSITMSGTLDEVKAQAIPFQEGDEVHVDLIEPHMYNAEDAVAKIDGYIIAVSGGVAHVGEKRLVRIEEAGRTQAKATLVETSAPEASGRSRPERPVAKSTQSQPSEALGQPPKSAITGEKPEVKAAASSEGSASQTSAPSSEGSASQTSAPSSEGSASQTRTSTEASETKSTQADDAPEAEKPSMS